MATITKMLLLLFLQFQLLSLFLFLNLALVCCCNRPYDQNPFPIIEGMIDKCNLKSLVHWDCYFNVKERINCHSCILENIRIKCPRLPDYLEWATETDCGTLRQCIYSIDFRKCYEWKQIGLWSKNSKLCTFSSLTFVQIMYWIMLT